MSSAAVSGTYPPPDRRQIVIHRGEDGAYDVGWYEGRMSDGRPYRAEMWAQNQTSMLTFFFSTRDLETASPNALLRCVQADGLVSFHAGVRPSFTARRWTDPAHNEFWSVNIVIGTEERIDIAASVPVARYVAGQTNSGFYPDR